MNPGEVIRKNMRGKDKQCSAFLVEPGPVLNRDTGNNYWRLLCVSGNLTAKDVSLTERHYVGDEIR